MARRVLPALNPVMPPTTLTSKLGAASDDTYSPSKFTIKTPPRAAFFGFLAIFTATPVIFWGDGGREETRGDYEVCAHQS